jgi:geranylgeranyl pyrophosphate synthase
MQLTDGTEMTACCIEDPHKPKVEATVDAYAITIAADGTRVEHNYPSFEPVDGKEWRSTQTFVEYPTEWTFSVGDMQLEIVADVKEQEFITLIAKPAFWEGRVRIKGTKAGKPVEGLGFIEWHGYGRENMKNLKYFFNEAGKEMRNHMSNVMPLDPTDEQLERLIGKDGYAAIDSFPGNHGKDAVKKNLIEPLRDTYDRGGKAWRSSAFTLCVDVVGGNSNHYSYLLPAPELLHAGSLIIDDIQDKSLTRRGKECCHILYGEEIAINAGCFSYFTVPGLYKQLPDAVRLKLMDLYFATMLAGHVGQGADIAGLTNIMPEVVETGNSELATQMIIGIHKLKSGIPVRHMAQGGCIIGGATDEQVEGLGDFFEQLGVAFQIIDDVVNLEGFTTNNWKTCGEDVMEGKVTFPIALAMKSLDKATRADVWEKVKSKPQDMETVKSVIDTCNGTGSLVESRKIAVTMVEEAWNRVAPMLLDSFSKMILRAFGLFVLERHY